MRDRLLDVTPATTLDVADGHAIGDDWRDDAAAVLDVDTPATGGTVTLNLELDYFGLHHLDQHVDAVSLTPLQARILATALADAAARAEPTVARDQSTHQ